MLNSAKHTYTINVVSELYMMYMFPTVQLLRLLITLEEMTELNAMEKNHITFFSSCRLRNGIPKFVQDLQLFELLLRRCLSRYH